MSFEVAITYGADDTPITISGMVQPEETTAVAVNITALLPKEAGTNRYTVRIRSTERESIFVSGRHILQATALPQIEVEALTGDLDHAVEVQARIGEGPAVRDMCPIACTVTLAPTR